MGCLFQTIATVCRKFSAKYWVWILYCCSAYPFVLHVLACLVLSGSAPLTAVQLLWVNMIMDTLGALALATEPPNNDLMKRAPVGRKGNFISNVMWRNILGQSLYQFVIIWYLQTAGEEIFHLDCPDSNLTLNTLIFNSFVFCQVTLETFEFWVQLFFWLHCLDVSKWYGNVWFPEMNLRLCLDYWTLE